MSLVVLLLHYFYLLIFAAQGFEDNYLFWQ